MTIYIPNYLRATHDEAVEIGEKDSITLNDLIRLHYSYYHNFHDFDGGLNIFDQLKKKLSLYYNNVNNWNINKIKEEIRNSCHPENEFMMILDEILTQDMIDCYGY